ncbi:hypothetical protein [Nonomuraea sp. NPDC050786]|uniref:hypothetical protein n=1 Tax=Nonomuraea sp. NPDC050786 TaxID=3154840 RepID=UPI0033C2A11B
MAVIGRDRSKAVPGAAFIPGGPERHGLPVEEGIKPIVALIDAPPAEPLSAFLREHRISVAHPAFAPAAAERLHSRTLELIDWGEGPAR